jgi:hypothetical protein
LIFDNEDEFLDMNPDDVEVWEELIHDGKTIRVKSKFADALKDYLDALN